MIDDAARRSDDYIFLRRDHAGTENGGDFEVTYYVLGLTLNIVELGRVVSSQYRSEGDGVITSISPILPHMRLTKRSQKRHGVLIQRYPEIGKGPNLLY